MSRNRPGEFTSGPVPAEYHGFSGTWDSRSRVFVFASCEERDRWQIRTYGQIRNAFRVEGEPEDERPLLVYHDPPFKDRVEQAIYETAVNLNPRRVDEGPFTYIRRISELVTSEQQNGPQAMPRARQSRRERDAALMRLRWQAGELNEKG